MRPRTRVLVPERPITINEAAWRSISADERTLIRAGLAAAVLSFTAAIFDGSLMTGELAFVFCVGLLSIVAPAPPVDDDIVYAEPQFFLDAERAARSLRVYAAFTAILTAFCVFHILYRMAMPF